MMTEQDMQIALDAAEADRDNLAGRVHQLELDIKELLSELRVLYDRELASYDA